jgi:hypothetical protein
MRHRHLACAARDVRAMLLLDPRQPRLDRPPHPAGRTVTACRRTRRTRPATGAKVEALPRGNASDFSFPVRDVARSRARGGAAADRDGRSTVHHGVAEHHRR